MSFFAYFALVSTDPSQRQALSAALIRHGFSARPVDFARRYGSRVMYGFDAPVSSIYEVELVGDQSDLEARLLEPEDPSARWRHYQACATALGRQVRDFRDDRDVDELYRQRAIELYVVSLLRSVSEHIRDRPLVLNLDPDFELHLGRSQSLVGLDAIREGTWRATAFSDLHTPLRLVIS